MRVYVAGHRGMVGSAVCRALEAKGHKAVKDCRTPLDLRDSTATRRQLSLIKDLDAVIMCAGRVGGIYANQSQQAEFLYDNASMALSVIGAAAELGIPKLIYLGSTCAYPPESGHHGIEDVLSGDYPGPTIEPTNEGYALAKILGIKLCQHLRTPERHYVTVMPCNVYGPGDNYDLETSHCMAALIRRLHEAKEAQSPVFALRSYHAIREFIYVDDLGKLIGGVLETLDAETPDIVNTGGHLVMLLELWREIRDAVGYQGEWTLDGTETEGASCKEGSFTDPLSTETPLCKGISLAYQDYLERLGSDEPFTHDYSGVRYSNYGKPATHAENPQVASSEACGVGTDAHGASNEQPS